MAEADGTVGAGTGGGAAPWDDSRSATWVELQDLLDGLYRPVLEALVDEVASVAPAEGARVLDVGCGTGATTVALARRLGRGARLTGLDVSGAMLDAARARAGDEGVAEQVQVVQADAQRHRFERAGLDVVTSRWGVMFFDDTEAAFANLHGATAPGGALRAVVWRSQEENRVMGLAEEAARDLVPVAPRAAEGPGPFALADPDRTRGLLERAGWSEPWLEPLDLVCTMPESDLGPYLTRLGPVGRALADADADAETRARVLDAVVPAFADHVADGVVRLPVACWMVCASA